jgi:hypothetical protein
MKYIAFWGWTNTRPKDTVEEAVAEVPKGSQYVVNRYPDGVSLNSTYNLPTERPVEGFELTGVK